jgi:hypothetical protein
MPSAAARSRVMRYRKTRATAISALNLALPFGQHGLINELPNISTLHGDVGRICLPGTSLLESKAHPWLMRRVSSTGPHA